MQVFSRVVIGVVIGFGTPAWAQKFILAEDMLGGDGLRWFLMEAIPRGQNTEAVLRVDRFEDGRHLDSVFVRWEVDCRARSYRELGDGLTPEQARRRIDNRSPMRLPVVGSVRSRITSFFCKEVAGGMGRLRKALQDDRRGDRPR
ncbi:hypothetical protein ACFQX4_27880 [Roseomonas sp. GCM10028921]